MPRITVAEQEIQLLGDQHLGKRFVVGVPLHRRGEREASQLADFKASLFDVDGCGYHINMGDLFDKMFVSNGLLMEVALIYLRAAELNRHCKYIIIGGNHDASKDQGVVSDFEMLAMLLRSERNIEVVRDWPAVFPCGDRQYFGVIPWHPTLSSVEQMERFDDTLYGNCIRNTEVHALFGHWDVESYGGSDYNLAPLGWLSCNPQTACYTGHEHKPAIKQIGGVTVNIVGSMQPFAHGEEANDVDDPKYITVTLEMLLTIDAELLSDKCVRVILQPGETLPADINCLQLVPYRGKSNEDDPDMEVKFEDFDMRTLFNEAFVEIPDYITEAMWNKYQELQSQDTTLS